MMKNLVDQLEYVDKYLQTKVTHGYHISENSFWVDKKKVMPTRKGMCLSLQEYSRLKEHLTLENTSPN